MTILDSIFDYNFAYFGGGFSLSANPETGAFNASNEVTLTNCTWIRNVARVGSAVDLTSFIDVSGDWLVMQHLITVVSFKIAILILQMYNL